MKTSQRLEQGLQQMQGWMVLRHNRSKTFHQYARIVRAFYVWLQARPEIGQLSSEKKIEAWLTMRARQGCAASTQNDRLPDALECLRRSNIVPLVMHRA